MKKNTSCDSYGYRGHGHCPPQSSCDQVKAKSVDSDLCPIPPWKGSTKLEHPFLDAQVPLADFELEVDVEADVCLPTPAREIKSIRKNVTLKQCKALPSSQSAKVVKLFITGILHKNIQYVEECSGFVRDHSTDITFTTIKRVELANPYVNPFGHYDIEFSQKASVSEYRELAKDEHGANPCISGSETFETFNEPIECKLLGTKIREIDLFKNFDNWGRFSTITEKAEIRLFLRLSQMQKVVFDPKPDHNHRD
ncbi:hypothetical protein JMM81_14495 [Bacillus sp. V3B]|uniref:CsxC family protein n=1 Tax=Bacillus sp. V3B TaxID=2804915 RepID=UPI00210AE88E|nr:hypothetical protein [Bacillus sp. V3B]MCQ6276134.1 hypothetical protein [Bacillus sp. V3B]